MINAMGFMIIPLPVFSTQILESNEVDQCYLLCIRTLLFQIFLSAHCSADEKRVWNLHKKSVGNFFSPQEKICTSNCPSSYPDASKLSSIAAI